MAVKDCTMVEAPQCVEDESLIEVAKKIKKYILRYIYVVDKSGKPLGVISTTDMNNRVVAEGKDPNKLVARDIMTSPIHSVEDNMDEREAYSLCIKNDVAACPVTQKGKIMGIVTVNELLRRLTHVG